MSGKSAKTNFIFVTGGVVSSLGKGLASASLGALLESRGLKVTLVKMDPYINVDPGTMNPFQHGEVFVTDDGAETDLDLGHYERFVSTPMTRKNKPTQHSVNELTGLCIQRDVLLCHTDRLLDKKLKAKIALFCNVEDNAVVTAKDVICIYELPMVFHDEGFDERIAERLNIWT